MAPLLPPKRALPPDPPDTGSRVSKTTTTTYRSSHTTKANALMSIANSNASTRGNLIENMLSEMHGSTDKEDLDIGEDDDMRSEVSVDEFPLLPGVTGTGTNKNPDISKSQADGNRKNSTAPLMVAIKGLLDLTNDYLQRLEEQHPGVGADFLAMLADGASRAMRGERVYMNASESTQTRPLGRQDTWAKRAESHDAGTTVYNLKRQTLKASPPHGQSKEDRRVMIRLGPGHEARKASAFELQQKIQELVTDKSLVSDLWSVPSGVAILAPTPAKAASLMQSKTVIEERLGNATVERQEKWTTFVVGPIPKKVRCLDSLQDPMNGLLLEELATVRDVVPIRYLNWTRKSQNDEPYGNIRICVPETRANKFPSRLRIFGEAVSIQRIRQRQQVIVCDKCFGYHTTRTCARTCKCKVCGMDAHTGPCQKPARCLNCHGPHSSTDVSCPVRPRRKNGVLVPPTGSQLQQIRLNGRKEFLKLNKQLNPHQDQTPSSTMETEMQSSSN